jgi:hypothetical protein
MRPLEEAKSRDGLVTMIGGGHPARWNFTTTSVKRLGETYWGLDVEMLPSISAESELFCKLGVDASFGGFSMTIAFSDAVIEDLEIPEPDRTSTICYSIDRLEIDTEYSIEDGAEYSSEQYHPVKTAYLSRFRRNIFNDDFIEKIKISDVANIELEDARGTLLFIPSKIVEKHMSRNNPELGLPSHKWDDEMTEQLTSGEVRDERHEFETTKPSLREESESELMDLIVASIEDQEIYIELMENTEEVLKEFDLTEREKNAIKEIRYQVSTLNKNRGRLSDLVRIKSDIKTKYEEK